MKANFPDDESSMNSLEIKTLDWQKMNGLIPAIVQNADNGQILMLGYMNQEALIATLTTGQLTLYSRTLKRVWRKGEDDGNSMALERISTDCDRDSLLVQVTPKGPCCHLGFQSCFQPTSYTTLGFLSQLIDLINEKAEDETSYTAKLLESGVEQCAKKTGEDVLDVIVAAATGNNDEIITKSAGIILHLLLLLKACNVSFYDVLACLQNKDT